MALTEAEQVIKSLKRGIWLYFLLLIFEGALRKWFLPFLAAPLLIVRDPIAIWLIYKAWKHNIVTANGYVIFMSFLCLLSMITALVFGHGSLPVAIYGARILLFHFPVMFIIGKVFTLSDVEELGKILLYISIPMAILIVLQFYSPQSAWVNRGVGGNVEGAGFSGAMGFFRPPGTFSFTTGNVLFFSFVACYIFYFWLVQMSLNKMVLIAATAGLIISIPLSISRTLMFSVGVTSVFMMLSVASKPKFLLRMIGFMVLGVLVLLILGNIPFFETATEAFTYRFDNASEIEGGVSTSLIDRFFGGMIEAVSESNKISFWGLGIGIGTNAGAVMLTGSRMFIIAEGEWSRLVGEMGFVVGMAVILLRVIFCADISLRSYVSMKEGNLLPWLLLSVGLLVIIQGQWAQPTVLGFSTLLGGLILAANNVENDRKLKNE
ncbi:membrane protein [Tamlana sedimentorum]|uniref:Membrane protein n=1 Tax=Neotamlana sedimentorum TaxID=1435349 RepID=A0A0D7WB92_9FLAO|nr:membrane protein [Tamlana sedimentorum]